MKKLLLSHAIAAALMAVFVFFVRGLGLDAAPRKPDTSWVKKNTSTGFPILVMMEVTREVTTAASRNRESSRRQSPSSRAFVTYVNPGFQKSSADRASSPFGHLGSSISSGNR